MKTLSNGRSDCNKAYGKEGPEGEGGEKRVPWGKGGVVTWGVVVGSSRGRSGGDGGWVKEMDRWVGEGRVAVRGLCDVRAVGGSSVGRRGHGGMLKRGTLVREGGE